MNWFIKGVSEYINFRGRARRREYWFYILFWYIGFILSTILDAVIASIIDYQIFNIFKFLFGVALLLPTYGVAVRRLHDIGKSAWWLLISLVPVIGSIWYLILMCLDGTPGSNQYGADPKGRGAVRQPGMQFDDLDNEFLGDGGDIIE